METVNCTANCTNPESTGTPLEGIMIAVISSFINGSSSALRKKGMLRSEVRGGSYLTDVVWWSGTVAMIVGQIGNSLAYSMAPAVIVAPLGGLGVLFGAVLASWILQEYLNIQGKLACVLCCCGAVVLLIYAPDVETLKTLPELKDRLFDQVFVVYALLVVHLLVILIAWSALSHGTSNIMVYAGICSLLGNFTIPSIKGLGLIVKCGFEKVCSCEALPLSLGLLGTLIVSILTQFFFLNKATERFSSNMFEAIYYVTFTSTVTLVSAILFKEWTALTLTHSIGMLAGLTTAFVGVVLLCISQEAEITSRKKKTE